jgi:hypothetical protein
MRQPLLRGRLRWFGARAACNEAENAVSIDKINPYAIVARAGIDNRISLIQDG